MKKTIGFIIFIALISTFACNNDTDEIRNDISGTSSVRSSSAPPTSPPPSCESFNFKLKLDTIWQEAAVKNIYMRILLLDANGSEKVHVISYPQPILFETPTNIKVDNATTTAGTAAMASAKILHDTMDKTIAKYGKTRVPDMVVDKNFRELLLRNYSLSIPGGRVKFNSATTLPATEYKTTFLYSSDCR